ncbi:MAG: DNA-binding protein WhiA [Ruminococcaceae bacterium]|nr:DNA-binding protein WhiA [Oscillospiraceae bacterium]
MNYSLLLKNELIESAPHNACCKRAYTAGLLLDLREMRENCLVLVISSAAARHECARAYRELYRREALLNGSVMLFASEKLYKAYKEPPVFACPQCRQSFLKGVMIACGSATDPQKAYRLEFRLANPEKVPILADFFQEMGWEPKCRSIEGGAALYFKQNAVLEEIYSTVGANNALFTLINAKIARDIRNEENRATNCVTRNIEKAVAASRKCCVAIEKIKAASRFEGLLPELRETAELRLAHQDANLAELAQLHNPPITKSGLNHRLRRIMAFAEGLHEN